VQQHYEAIRRLGAEVLVVTQAQPPSLAEFLREQPLPFPIVADPTRAAYRAFGLSRTSWRSILRPGSILRYLKLIFRGWRPRRKSKGEDVLQLGGDFILDAQGRLTHAHRSTEPTDRPGVEVLLGELTQAAQRRE
jgi:peroxiredoxin